MRIDCRSFTATSSLILILFASLQLASTAQDIPKERPPEELPADADLITWNSAPYPLTHPDSVANVGKWLFDAPAGKHGHVRKRADGQLEFEDGTPARFWGTTTVFGMTFPEKPAEVEKLADAIAAAGYNMVRFHHNDFARNGLGYLQEKPKSNYLLDPKGMERLDRFAAALIKRGIYIYVDLVDYREFLEEDGIPDWEKLRKLDNRGWKGVFPHPAVVKAWKRAVTEFLSHKNPYTGRTWGEEPAAVTIEIINENGLFWDWSFKVSDYYHKWHDLQWNLWLKQKYKTRAALAKAWTDSAGKQGLFPDEDPAKGTVFRPRFSPLLEWDRPYRSKTRGAARVNDYNEHMAETAISFYQDAAKHIRGLGFKGLIIGSHELRGPINQYAEVKGTGVLAAHLYAPGDVAWRARPTVSGAVMDGVDVKTNNWFSNIPRVKVQGVPGINGEWTGGSLTRRADVNIAVAAITSIQGLTQSAHFSYAHRWRGTKQRNFDITYDYVAWRKKFSRTFSSIHDVPWMAANRICSSLFIRHDFAPAKTKAHIAFSKEDLREQNLHALGLDGGGGTIGNAALFLPLLHDVECTYFDQVYTGDADVVFMTGRTASGDYSKAKHAVVIGDNPYCDRYHKKRDLGFPARQIHKSVQVVNIDQPIEFVVSSPWKQKTLSFGSYEGAIVASTVPSGAQLIGKSKDGKYTLGWLDDKFLVLPNGRAFGKSIGDVQWLYRLYVTACKRWKIDQHHNSPDAHAYQFDNAQLTVDWAFGTTIINTPKTQALAGLLGWRKANVTDNLTCTIQNPYANVLVTSADNLPIAKSSRMLLVAAGRMKNTGQQLGKDKNGFTNFTKTGTAPMLVEGIRGRIKLTSEKSADLVVYALDSEGRRLGKVTTKAEGGVVSWDLSPKWGTIWYEVATSDIAGPAAPAQPTWPLAEQAAPQYAKPTMVALDKFFAEANTTISKGSATQTETKPTNSVTGKDFKKDPDDYKLIYGNIKCTVVNDVDKGKVLKAQFGKVNKGWNGGFWSKLSGPQNAAAADFRGFIIAFKGDGTLPREAYFTVRTTDGASYRSGNINKLFENDSWQDVLLASKDFKLDAKYAKKHPGAPPLPDWSKVTRFDFNCVGPLMDQKSVGYFDKFSFAMVKGTVLKVKTAAQASAKLPKPGTPESAKISIPYVAKATVNIDGSFTDDAWSKALGIAMDEDNVPNWHFFGSHVVEGKRLRREGANFWLLATDQGLLLAAQVIKDGAGAIAEKANWWGCDCVEVFTDVKNAGKKPTKQLFFAYRRPGFDRPATSAQGAKIARTKLDRGYMLEALIPWQALGFSSIPDAEFGLEFQVDYAYPGTGRALQMTYGTGTNEAWIKSDNFLKASIRK